MNNLIVAILLAVSACTSQNVSDVIVSSSAFHVKLGQLIAPIVTDSGNQLLSASVQVKCNDTEAVVTFCVRTTDPEDPSAAVAECTGQQPCLFEVQEFSVSPADTIIGPRQTAELLIASNQLEVVEVRGARYATMK